MSTEKCRIAADHWCGKYSSPGDFEELGQQEAFFAGWNSCAEEMDHLKFVPGHFECKKCGFHLIAKTLYMKSGTVGSNNKPQECSNGCGPMWRVSWQDYANTLYQRLETLAERAANKDE